MELERADELCGERDLVQEPANVRMCACACACV